VNQNCTIKIVKSKVAKKRRWRDQIREVLIITRQIMHSVVHT